MILTLDIVLDEIGRDTVAADRSVESWIERQIAAVSSELSSGRWCDQPLEYRQHRVEFCVKQPLGLKSLSLHPIHEITSLEYRSTPTSDWTVIAEGWALQRNEIDMLYLSTSFYPGYSYRATLMMGYWPLDAIGERPTDQEGQDVPEVPLGLQQVALDMIVWKYYQKHKNHRYLKSEASADERLTKSLIVREEMEKEWLRDIAPYRRLGVTL